MSFVFDQEPPSVVGSNQEPNIVGGSLPGTDSCCWCSARNRHLWNLSQRPTIVVGSWPAANSCSWFLARHQQLPFVRGQEPTMVVCSRPRTIICVWFQAKNQPLLVPGQEPTILVGAWQGTHKCWRLFWPGTNNNWLPARNHQLLLVHCPQLLLAPGTVLTS